MEIIVTAAIVGAIVYGLERNRARLESQPHAHLAGSTDVQDRDNERISCELLGRA